MGQFNLNKAWFGPEEEIFTEGFEDLFSVSENYEIPPSPSKLSGENANLVNSTIAKITEGAKMLGEGMFSKEKEMFGKSFFNGPKEEKQEVEEKPVLKVVPPSPETANSSADATSEVSVMEPRSFEDSLEIADQLKQNKSVILNLQYLDNETSQRVIDFLSGATYSFDGTQQRVGQGVFIFAPKNYKIETEAPSTVAYKDIFAKTFGV